MTDTVGHNPFPDCSNGCCPSILGGLLDCCAGYLSLSVALGQHFIGFHTGFGQVLLHHLLGFAAAGYDSFLSRLPGLLLSDAALLNSLSNDLLSFLFSCLDTGEKILIGHWANLPGNWYLCQAILCIEKQKGGHGQTW